MRVTYTFHSTRPRILTRDTAELATRSNNVNGWKNLYDMRMLVEASRLESSEAIAAIASDKDRGHAKLLTLALVGIIENNSTYRQKALDVAVFYSQSCAAANNVYGDFTDTTGARNGAQLLAYALDLLDTQPEMTSGIRATLIAGLIKVGDLAKGKVSTDGAELIDGLSGGNAVAEILCGIALGSDNAHGAEFVQHGLEFWYGTAAGDSGRIDYDRYFSSNGGSGKGIFYCLYSQHYTQLLLRAIENGFVRNADTPGSLLLDGEEYAPFVDEDWVGKIPEWILRHGYRGDKDYLSLGDTSRITNPVFAEFYQVALSGLMEHAGTWRPPLFWLWNELHAWADGLGQFGAYYYALNFALWDRATVTAQHPKTLSIPASKWFSPPGHYHCIAPTFDPVNACDITISLEERDYRGHKHRDCGCIQIGLGDDRILLDSGFYATTDTAADYQGTHNNNWHKQSIAHSGVPLVEGVAADLTDRHGNRDRDGVRQWYYNGLGGQNWKWIGGFNGTWTPGSIKGMLEDGSGLAWLRCTSRAELGAAINGVTTDFVSGDLRRAYVAEASDYGGATERTRIADVRMLVIRGVAPWPVVFRVARIKSRLATMKKRDHWHFHGAPSIDGGKFYALGSKGKARCLIDYYGSADFTMTVVGGGAQSGGIGEYDFFWNGQNWRPTSAPSWRNVPDCGHYRMEISSSVAKEEDYFACLLMPLKVAEAPVAYTLFEEASWYGVDFSGREFRIHKTLDTYMVGLADIEPPGVVQNVAAIPGPGIGNAKVTWNPNTDDAALYRIFYQEQ